MHAYFATAAKGTEGALRDELRALRFRGVRADRGGVHFEGELREGMRACLWSRIAMRVLLHLGRLPAAGEEELYAALRELPWEEHLDARRTFALSATVRSSAMTHSHYVALKAKDAIVDRFREKRGERPSVDTKKPDVSIVIHLAKDVAEVSIDLAGEPLHRRGWRTDAMEAPLRETLAAAMLAIGGYDPQLPFCDPMCGSGTLAIEAALIARQIAPGRGRHFGFMRWPRFGDAEAASFRELQDEAKAIALPKAPALILGRDRFEPPLEAARQNAQRAGVTGSIEWEREDARELAGLPEGCQLFVNPPYGERLGAKRLQLEGLYRGFGEAYRPLSETSPLAVLAGSPLFERAFGLRARSRQILFNGPIEAPLVRYGPAPAVKRLPARVR